LRQAYDYWQDQPGSCHTSHAAGCSLSKATDTGERNPAAGAARLDVRCIGMEGIHPHAGLRPPGAPPAQLSVFARLSIQPRHRRRCGTQTPPSWQRCGCSRRRVCCAGSRPRRTSSSVRTSRSGGAGVPARLPFVFIQACTSCIGTSSQHLGRGLFCWRKAGPDGRRIFRKWIRKHPGPSTDKGVGSRPTRRRSHAARSGPAAPHCHSPPTSGTAFGVFSDAPAASLPVGSSTTDWSPASPSSGLVSRF
jgi:hypothetical protein